MLFICLCLAVWLCLKMSYENSVLVRLLQIGATDLTVYGGYGSWQIDQAAVGLKLVCCQSGQAAAGLKSCGCQIDLVVTSFKTDSYRIDQPAAGSTSHRFSSDQDYGF